MNKYYPKLTANQWIELTSFSANLARSQFNIVEISTKLDDFLEKMNLDDCDNHYLYAVTMKEIIKQKEDELGK